MKLRVARGDSRSVWVNICENADLDEEQFLKDLREKRAVLTEGEPIDRVFIEAVDDLVDHIGSGYEGKVILATVDYVFQLVDEDYALRANRSMLDFPDVYVEYDNENERIYLTKHLPDDVNNTFESNFRNVQATLGTWPVTIAPMEELREIQEAQCEKELSFS